MAHRRTKRHRSRKHKTRRYRKQRGGEDKPVAPSQPIDLNKPLGKDDDTKSFTNLFNSLGSLLNFTQQPDTPSTQKPDTPATVPPTGGKRRRKRRTNRR